MATRFLTLADVAEALNISAAQTYALVRTGELPAIKIGGRGQWRIEATQLEHYITRMYQFTKILWLPIPSGRSLHHYQCGKGDGDPPARLTIGTGDQIQVISTHANQLTTSSHRIGGIDPHQHPG